MQWNAKLCKVLESRGPDFGGLWPNPRHETNLRTKSERPAAGRDGWSADRGPAWHAMCSKSSKRWTPAASRSIRGPCAGSASLP